MKILITGSQGMAAEDFIAVLGTDNIVTPVDKPVMDITVPEDVHRVFKTEKPACVIHLAALTDVDYCEQHPEEAYRVNAEGTKNIALQCVEAKALMVYISTSSVFDGRSKQPYSEDDLPNPPNIYGKSKFDGERYVQKILDMGKRIIVRAGWFFGGGKKDKNFVGKVISKLNMKQDIHAVTDLFGSPTYTHDLAEGVKFLILNKFTGLFHLANEGCVSRYDIACKIVEHFAEHAIKVYPQQFSELDLLALRPRMEALVNKRLNKTSSFRMRSWEDSLGQYLFKKLL